MDRDEKKEFLKSEYFHLQSIIEDFDKRALVIKAWSVSLSFGGISIAFVRNESLVLLIACFSSLVFWFLETQWKVFQNAYYKRSQKIEQFFRDSEVIITPLQIESSWRKSYGKDKVKDFVKILFWPHVALPHVIVFLLGLIFYLLDSFEKIDI